MLGALRASSISSLELLEMERPSSFKIVKHDSLSIYESTILKLKQGSHSIPRDSARISAVATDSPEEAMTDADHSSSGFFSNDSSKEKQNTNMSILHLFTKYKKLHHAQSSDTEVVMAMESGSSSNFLPTSESCQLLVSSSRSSLIKET